MKVEQIKNKDKDRGRNGFFKWINRLFNLIVLNGLFVLMSLPIFTIGANLTATYKVCTTMFSPQEDLSSLQILKIYFKNFKLYFKKSTWAWFIMLTCYCLLFMDIFISNHLENQFLNYSQYIFYTLLFFIILINQFLFSLISQVELSVINIYKLSFHMLLTNFLAGCAMIAIFLVPMLVITILFTQYLATYLFLLLIVGCILFQYVNSQIFNYSMRKMNASIR